MELSIEQYKQALQTDGILKGNNLELLSILYEAPNCEASGYQIAEVLGYNGFQPVNAVIGKLGKRIALHFGYAKDDIRTEYSGWWQMVANGKYSEDNFVWSLKNNFFDALVELDLLQTNDSFIFPEVISENDTLTEGSKKTVTVNAYERSPLARKLCIKHHGISCSVCDFDFSEKYGKLGEGFIHVHHLLQLSVIQTEYIVDPIKDLRPVCPNCHAMLHKTKPAISIEELKGIISK
ncbi:HNH endonuclease [Colwellia piezophila]|uniref:HNH endonuclease n=1 Tax=Colwellia piezophila TaxID=211668 RepID=UPI00035F1A71|nr:HNH endonuclease [Colwellia piezophila]